MQPYVEIETGGIRVGWGPPLGRHLFGISDPAVWYWNWSGRLGLGVWCWCDSCMRPAQMCGQDCVNKDVESVGPKWIGDLFYWIADHERCFIIMVPTNL